MFRISIPKSGRHIHIPNNSAFRTFSSYRPLASHLSYQVFGPESNNTATAAAAPAASQNPIIFLHGLFGSKQNNRTISRALARDLKRQIYTLDLRNHGHSFHADEHNYTVMAEDVEKFMDEQELKRCVLVGHSMGAKTAMAVALRSPDRISALIPVDNAPVFSPLKSDFPRYVRGMQHVEKENVSKQSDADAILKDYEESLPIRQFLLTNLIRSPADDGTLKFRIPISILGKALDDMADFPFREPGSVTYNGPTLVVRGTRSKYVSDETIPAIRKFFPRARVADIDAGHWVISENPEAFRKVVVDFLREADDE